VSSSYQLERIDEDLQVEICRQGSTARNKQLVIRITTSRTLTFTERSSVQAPLADPHDCQWSRMIV